MSENLADSAPVTPGQMASAAEELLHSSAFQTALEYWRWHYTSEWAASAPDQFDFREKAYHRRAAVDDLVAILQEFASMEKIARNRDEQSDRRTPGFA